MEYRVTGFDIAHSSAKEMGAIAETFRQWPGTLRSPWQQTADVADDMGRLFPDVGTAFEDTGQVIQAKLGLAECRLCGFADLVDYASTWISAANRQSGDLH
ncbi:AAC(3) family N-acetyltransferase [Parasedimentitalea marina]|uniref:AAC(3) family N-acetyltransferase n=1 Tax=Parasedimentitalea marina TaxID=2483033 RepID=UPI00237C272D|nr:AAC(3) family N-acetyltransferase [Parasedimentitalea marina]